MAEQFQSRCSRQSACFRKHTDRFGAENGDENRTGPLWGSVLFSSPFLVSLLGNINEFLSVKGRLDTFPVSGDQVHDGDRFSDGEDVWLFSET